MGAWSTFTAGSYRLSAKYRIPYFALFLFQREDLLVIAEEEPGEEYPHYSFVGFSTTVATALERLESAGYGSEFFSEVLAPHLEGFEEDYIATICEESHQHLDEAAAIDRAAELERVDFAPTIRSDVPPLEQFLDFLRAIADGRRRRGLNRRMANLGAPDGMFNESSLFSGRGELLRDHLWGLAFDASPYIPRGVVQTSHQILSICDDYGDFYELFLAWVLLSISSDNLVASVEFADLIEPPDVDQKAIQMLEQVREDVVMKLNAYNSAFSIIAERDPALADRAQRQEIGGSLLKAVEEGDTNKKGKMLEDSISDLFGLSNAFEISSRRLNLEDEELDIVLHNNSERPFFLGLQSPLILVECKNWSAPVGAAELRNFEGKVRNHWNLCRVGVFVGVNGFTGPVQDYLRRLGRDGPVLALVAMDELSDFLAGAVPFEEWLQAQIAGALA